MIAKYTSGSGSSSRDKKLHQEAMAMLDDSKRKIEYIRMQQLLLRSKIHGTQSGVWLVIQHLTATSVTWMLKTLIAEA